MIRFLHRCWEVLRTLAGDDAYERYCAHHQHCHAGEPLLDRRAYYMKNQQMKWSGVNRCC
jgi:uncharacterized short protein YbdD (DUF466 family)